MNKGYIHSTEIMTNKLSNTFGTVGGGTERGKGRGSENLIYSSTD